MIEFIIEIIGFILIWSAVGIGREEDSRIRVFSTYWWVALILIAIGTSLVH